MKKIILIISFIFFAFFQFNLAKANNFSKITKINTNTYCTSKGLSTTGEWIQKVSIGAISFDTGNNQGYLINSNSGIVVSAGSSYQITLKPGFTSQNYTEYWKVWIDFNQDNDFDDAGELVLTKSGTTEQNASITIPTTAKAGSSRMRISMKGDAVQTACETFSYGEVEDYSIYINANAINSVTISHPATATVGQSIVFSGTASSNISRVVISVDGYTIKDMSVTNGSYSFNYAFTSAGTNRQIVVKGYNSSGTQLATQNSTITVNVSATYSVTISHPATATVGQSITISGTASAGISKVKVSVDGWEIKDMPVTNGTYSFSYTFNTAGNNRQIVVKGYNSAGTQLATKNSTITVNVSATYSVTISHPATATVGQSITISGTASAGISKVKVAVDGWEIKDMPVTNGSYSFAYTFNTAGNNRAITVNAFNSTGSILASTNSSITINSQNNNNNLGIWLYYLDYTGFTSHSQLANALVSMGVKRIYIKVANGAYNPTTWPEISDPSIIATYKNAGLQVWAWSYNYPGNEVAQADALYYAAKIGYEGYILDVEEEFSGITTGLHTLFSEFVKARQDAINAGYATSDFKIGETTFGNPGDHNIDVGIMDQYVDYHFPQTYTEIWNVLNNQEYWINYGTQEYISMGCSKPIYHICAAEKGIITSSQINQFINIAGSNTSIWSVPSAAMHSKIWPVLQNVNWNQSYSSILNVDDDIEINSVEKLIYPNPTSDFIYLDIDNEQNIYYDVVIYDISGKIVYNKKNNEARFELNTDFLTNGMYFITIQSDEFQTNQKFVVKK